MARPQIRDADGSEDDAAARVLAPLLNSVDTAELSFSFGGALALFEALRAAPYKKSESDIISSTTVVLTATLMAIGLAENDIASESADPPLENDERRALRAWGRILRRKKYNAALQTMAQDFFSEVPRPHFGSHLDYDVPSGAELSRGMRVNLAGMGQRVITVARLVKELASDSGSGIAKRLGKLGITDLTDGLRDGPQDARRAGSPVMMREAAAGELTLDVHQYAAAVATVLRAAVGEFTFALYGKWGSGKTTLTTVLEPLMTEPDSFRKAVSSAGESFASLRYAVARHNAWKYRTPPEAWIYTYKSLADAAAAQLGPVERLLLAVRRTVFRRGAWPAAGGMLALVVLLTPLELKLQLTALIASVAGFSAVLHLLSVGSSAARRVRELFAEHTQLASHEDKLGMLALIGDDVRSLLLAWVKPRDASKYVSWGKIWMPAAAIALAGAVWCTGLADGFAPGWPEFLPRILPAEWLTLVPASPGRATHGDWAVFIAWLLFAIVLFVAPWLPITKTSSRPDRVLLIVDDLDRCQPEEMLSVIEGLKLLLDIPEVAERLQISMLVDEDVLGHAISRRYRAMINERVEAMSADLPSSDPARRLLVERNIIAEQTEKLFACSLRIGALKAAQLASLIAKLAGREFDAIRDEADGSEGLKRTMESEMNPGTTEGDRPVASRPVKSEEPEDKERDDGGTDSEGGSSTDEEAPQLSAADVRFTSSEILTLQQRVPQYFAAVGRLPSPRAVRMLTFKIQLCRFLLQQRSTESADWSVDAILDALTAAQRDFDEKEDLAVTIARQVI